MADYKARKILIADDEESIRELTSTILSRNGHTVYTTSNGREALQKAEELGYDIDIVLTDSQMPQLDGIGLAQRLRERNYYGMIVLMSGNFDWKLLPGYLDSSLQKPFTAAELMAALELNAPRPR